MNNTVISLRNILNDTFSPVYLDVIDESHHHAGHAEAGAAQETHFRIVIASLALSGKPKVAQHRLIYQAVDALMNNPIHALAIDIRNDGA